MPFTKNLCRSQNKFADIRNKITGASCSKLSRYCAVIIAEENGIELTDDDNKTIDDQIAKAKANYDSDEAYLNCGNAWGKWRLVSVAIFIAHKKRGTLAPMYFLISSQTEIQTINK